MHTVSANKGIHWKDFYFDRILSDAMKNDFIVRLFLDEFFAVLCVSLFCAYNPSLFSASANCCEELRCASDDTNERRRISTAFTLWWQCRGEKKKFMWINQVVMRIIMRCEVLLLLFQQFRINLLIDTRHAFLLSIRILNFMIALHKPSTNRQRQHLIADQNHFSCSRNVAIWRASQYFFLLFTFDLQMELHGIVGRGIHVVVKWPFAIRAHARQYNDRCE